ncbi:MAG: ATP-binding protein [Gemmataceae bacterium]
MSHFNEAAHDLYVQQDGNGYYVGKVEGKGTFNPGEHVIIEVPPMGEQTLVARQSEPTQFVSIVLPLNQNTQATAKKPETADERQTLTSRMAGFTPLVSKKTYPLKSDPTTESNWSDPKIIAILTGCGMFVCCGLVWVLILCRTIRTQTEDLRKRSVLEQELAEKLRQSQKMEAIGRLAGGIAHDFNNLLTVINGSAELLPDYLPEESEARNLTMEIHKAGEKAAGLVAQLLTFSRQRPATLQAIDINEVISDSEKLLRRLLGEDLLLVISKGIDLPPILAEPILLHQVLMNLAVNSRDAMPRGGRLTITTLSNDKGVCLRVADTGCGMSPEVLQRVFEPFFTTKDVGKGTGLGLATVYGIVQTIGAEIRVRSEVGKGTVFEIDFPVAPPPSCGSGVEKVSLNQSSQHAPLTTILLVEDDDAVRALTSRVLERDGYRVLVAETPSMAFGILSTDRADILITDVVMPGMGGRELAEKVRAILPRIKVLYMSGYTADEVLRRGVQEEEVNFLNKPFTNAALSACVAKLVENKKSKTKSSTIKLPQPLEPSESVVCY